MSLFERLTEDDRQAVTFADGLKNVLANNLSVWEGMEDDPRKVRALYDAAMRVSHKTLLPYAKEILKYAR